MNHPKRLMILEDDELFAFLTIKTIEKTNLVEIINAFKNGLDGLNFLKENSDNTDLLPDIILLDLSMPIMDGWQFLEEFKKLKFKKRIPIYVCTAAIIAKEINRANAIGIISDFIIKPISKQKLIELLENLES